MRVIAMALAAVAMVLAVAHPVSPTAVHANAQSYSCDVNHCYGIARWGGPTLGASTDITIHNLNQGDGFVTNEVWLGGDPPSNLICPNTVDGSGGGDCWVEVGNTIGNLDTANVSCYQACYYWADQRPSAPGTVNNYWEHFVDFVPASDLNTSVVFRILQATDGPGRYDIQIFDKGCLARPDYADVSTQDQLASTHIDIGSEVAGTSGASSGPTEYTDNQWLDSGGWHYQTNPGGDPSGSNHAPAVPHRWDQVPTGDGFLPGSGWGQTHRGGFFWTQFP